MTTDREAQWLTELKEQVHKARRACLLHLRSLGKDTSQEGLRALSWALSLNPSLEDKAIRRFHALGLPAGIASSPQDIYHHTHFIRAVVGVQIHPELNPTLKATEVFKLAEVAPDETLRAEAQLIVYSELARKAPQIVKERVTLEMIHSSLNRLHQKVDALRIQLLGEGEDDQTNPYPPD